MRALRDPDAFPATDLVLRRHIGSDEDRAETWRPWRSYAAMHIWHSSAMTNISQGSAVTHLKNAPIKETT